MNISIISDTHFNHKNIQEYCNRPDGWTKQLIENMAVIQSDILIHLGDVSLGNDPKWHNFVTESFTRKNWLVLGNHDGKSMSWYLNHGWDFVARNFTIYYYGLRILFSHRPYPFPPMKTITRELARDVAHSEVMVDKERSNFDINIAGHVHNRRVKLETWQKPFILEEQDYKPIDLKEFLHEEINQKNKDSQTARALQEK